MGKNALETLIFPCYGNVFMVDRKVLLLSIVIAGSIFALVFDPLSLSKDGSGTSQLTFTTGLFAGGGFYATVLPGVVFLAVISLIFVLSKEKKEE